MNTKYPTNGRYATLGDIVHEYRNYATVDITDSSDNKSTESLLDYIQSKPYELVWFDNVYSNTEKSEDGKSMKIIQHDSSSNYDRYILANELQSNSNNFTFYVATANEYKDNTYNDIKNIATSYYFNYKTSNGESTLLYIFNEIKNLVNDSSQLKDLFGNKIVDYNDYTSFDFIKELNNYTISENTNTYSNIVSSAQNSKNKKYTTADNNVKLYFYIKLYNNICRFVTGKLSDLTLSKVTKITYKQNEPVYRCDIGINDQIKSFTVIEVLHDETTALPAGALSGNTEMKFTVSYNIMYEHSSSETSGHYSFSLTFDTIKALTEDPSAWKSVVFISVNDNEEHKYGDESGEFPYIENIKDNNGNLTYGSLTNFLWPPADASLKVDNLSNYTSNSSNLIENSNNSTYLTEKYKEIDTNYNKNIHKYFGSLRIHTAYKTTTEKDIQDTSFKWTVPIYRHKNYYIDGTKSGDIDTADIYIQLDPIYKNEKLKSGYLPNIQEKITLRDGDYNPSNLNVDYIVPYKVQDNTFSFISILLLRGTVREFLSGKTEILEQEDTQYVNDIDYNIQSYENNQWVQTSDITLTPVQETSDTVNLYKLQVNESSNNIKYFRIGLKENDEYKKYIYLKKSSNITSSNKLKVKLFKTINNYDNSLNLLVYNSNKGETDYYTYNTIGFGYDADIKIQSFSNLYIQVSCIKSTTLFNNRWIYKLTDIDKIYYSYKNKSGNYTTSSNNLFDVLSEPINIYSTVDSKGYHLYMSLSPIFIIYDETNNDNIQITYTINDNNKTTIKNKGYECISDGSKNLSITNIKVIYNGDISLKKVNGIIKLNDTQVGETISFNSDTTYDKSLVIVLNNINKVSCVIEESDKDKTISITWDDNAGKVTSSSKTINNGSNTFTLTELTSGINITIEAYEGYYLDKESDNQDSNGTMSMSDTINSNSSDKKYEFKEGYNVTCTCENGSYKFSDYKGKQYNSIYTNTDSKSEIIITPEKGYEIESTSDITSSAGITVNSKKSGENMVIEIAKITQNGTITVKCKQKSATDTTTP